MPEVHHKLIQSALIKRLIEDRQLRPEICVRTGRRYLLCELLLDATAIAALAERDAAAERVALAEENVRARLSSGIGAAVVQPLYRNSPGLSSRSASTTTIATINSLLLLDDALSLPLFITLESSAYDIMYEHLAVVALRPH